MAWLERTRPWLLPVGLLLCLAVILMPLPPVAMDMLLAGNLALAVIIFITALRISTPLEFSVFPTILLATTLSRLVLNIATTRLILTNAVTDGPSAAGDVIRVFGQFVAGNQIEVGLVIFAILIVVQFVVITKGATRISEVAARFALDGMPGRQSAIEADLNGGKIDAQEAAENRENLIAEADFYAAMDGAGKFVRGDAIAGLIITAINLTGGLYLGVVVFGMPFADATSTLTKLTIGDGLVSQIPSLLISLAAGILVTRGTRRSNLSDNVVTQLLGNYQSLVLTGIFLLALTLTGLPRMPLILLSAVCLTIAWNLYRQQQQQAEQEQQLAQQQSIKEAQASTQKRVEDFLSVDPFEVAIGLGLLPLADPSRGGDLMQRIAGLRNQMAAEVGIVLPKVRVRDDATLGSQEYELRLFGDFVARGTLHVDKLYAFAEQPTTGTLPGEPATLPTIGTSAVWIDPEQREQALIYGYKTQTAAGFLATHLEATAKTHADELLSHDATQHLIEELRQVAPALIDNLIPNRIAIADIQRVLQGLLREGIPIRQLGIILEAMGAAAEKSSDTGIHIEAIRGRLARTISAPLKDSAGKLHAVVPSDSVLMQWQNSVNEFHASNVSQSQHTDLPSLRKQFLPVWNKVPDVTCNAIRQGVKELIRNGYPPVVVVPPQLRRYAKVAMEAAEINVPVLATTEIDHNTTLAPTVVSPLPATSHRDASLTASSFTTTTGTTPATKTNAA